MQDQKGAMVETLFRLNRALEEVERTGRGHDLKTRRHNIFTGKTETTYYEVKTGNSRLSELQEKNKT